jgi:PAT family beta-lactamase induction signal transducer AmpG
MVLSMQLLISLAFFNCWFNDSFEQFFVISLAVFWVAAFASASMMWLVTDFIYWF